MTFHDRTDAGKQLARALAERHFDDPVVVALPRGGVPVALEVARALHAPLDVILVRKLGAPMQPELAMGAIGEGGVRVLADRVVASLHVSEADIAAVEARERVELERRARRFRGPRDWVPLAGRTAIVVDDGIATGSTARAACAVARAHGARRIIFAAPVGPIGVEEAMADVADDVVVLDTPVRFFAIGQFYDDFTQVSDEEVVEMLDRAHHAEAGAQGAGPAAYDAEVTIKAGPVVLSGRLTLPAGAREVVTFAHGSGSSRHSPRNQYVAEVLQAAGLGTLLFDLLTVAEERDRANVFDIQLLADRLRETTDWLRSHEATAGLAIGYFGASTGAAAALGAAAASGNDIAAVVSRGGRPDLAMPVLHTVRAPTLLIVGGDDTAVLELNRKAYAALRCERRLEIVPGASHLFEEPGTLARAAELARDWFCTH